MVVNFLNQIISNKLSGSRYHEKMYENDITKWADSLLRKKIKGGSVYMMYMFKDNDEGIVIYAIRGNGQTIGNIATNLDSKIIRIVLDNSIVYEEWKSIMERYIGYELVTK